MNGGVRKGLNSLSQRIIGANTIVQGALPNILKQTPESFFQETLQVIEGNAKVLYIFNIIDGIDYLDAIDLAYNKIRNIASISFFSN